jgi:hypothetical protein
MPTWTDQVQAWTAVGSLLIALGAAWFVVVTIRQAASALRAQRVSTDIASVLVIWERLDGHWIRFRSTNNDEDRSFEFGQLITYYEMACALFRDRVFTTRAARTLHEHLHEILPAMQQTAAYKELFDKLKSRDQTFENIRWFCNHPPPSRRSEEHIA